MKTKNCLIVIIGILMLSISACSGTFTIKDDQFSASSVCDGEGVLIFQTVNGEIQVQAAEELSTFMRQAGMPNAWCHGYTHTWEGESTFGEYTFASDPGSPLSFMVDRDKGYVYLSGSGEVTTPEGESIKLP